MKLRLRRHETRKTLNLQLAATSTLHDLQRCFNPSAPSSVHFSLNRKDKLLAPSPAATLQSLGIVSGDLVYFSLDPFAFVASVWGMVVSKPMHVDQLHVAVAGSKRLSEPFFLKKILLEKCGDNSDLTILAVSVHAVMLESGFVFLNNHVGSEKFSFSKELFTVSLRYTLPELVTNTTTVVEYVTVRFQNFSDTVVVYGSLSGCRVQRVSLNKNRFASVIELVMDALKFEKQVSCSCYKDVFTFWRMVKDGLVLPLLIGLCEKSGLEIPPCLMGLPKELKLKILESIPGTSVAKMACVCTEMRGLASDNDLWKLKYLEEEAKKKTLVVNGSGESSANWKAKFVFSWRERQNQLQGYQKYLTRSNLIPLLRNRNRRSGNI